MYINVGNTLYFEDLLHGGYNYQVDVPGINFGTEGGNKTVKLGLSKSNIPHFKFVARVNHLEIRYNTFL
jgi:hypothetical protein